MIKNKIGLRKIREYALLGFLVVIIIANVFYTIGVAASGAEIAKLENDGESLAKNIQAYSEQIMNKSSLSAISQEATGLGFAKPQNIIYISDKESMAQLP